MAQNGLDCVKQCPECGCNCLDVFVDSEGEIFYYCLRCDEITPESGIIYPYIPA